MSKDKRCDDIKKEIETLRRRLVSGGNNGNQRALRPFNLAKRIANLSNELRRLKKGNR